MTRYNNVLSDSLGLLRQNVFELLEDRDGVIWIGTNSELVSFEPNTESVTRHVLGSQDPTSLDGNAVTSMVEDDAGTLWIGTSDRALHRLDRGKNTFITYTNERPDGYSFLGQYISELIVDRNGSLWIGSLGLSRFEPETDTFTTFYPDPENFTSNTADPLVFNNFITALYEDRDGNLWAGTRVGLFHFDPETETFTSFKHNPDQPGSLNEDWITSLYQDRFGALWVGTRLLGLNRADLSAALIPHRLPVPTEPQNPRNYIQAILEDRSGNLWVGNLGGVLDRTNPQGEMISEYQHDPSNPASLTRGNAQVMLEDAAGALWIGTGLQYQRGTAGGLSRYDPETDTFSRIVFDPDQPTLQVLTLAETPSEPGILWIGTYGGLYRYDTGTATATHYEHDPANPYSLSDDQVQAIYEDKSGTLWIGTVAGLNRLNRRPEPLMADAETEVFTRFAPFAFGNEFVAIHEDRRTPGILWIADRSGSGLVRFDTSSEQFSFFNEANSGLANNIVYGILDGEDGNLWLSTQGGLSRFSPETGNVKNYGVSQGLLSREFNTSSFHKGRSGTLYFGGIKGYNAFKPEDIGENPYPPDVVITDLKLFNTAITPSPDGILQEPVSITKTLTLAHDDNDLTFDYVGLHFSNADRIRYSYWLENYDDTWRDVGPQRTATYTNLDPGTYTFRVKAANSDGVWNEEGTSLTLTIRPPWWRTVWAYLFYGILGFGAVVGADRIQRQRVVRKEREKARERELAQAREIEKAHVELRQSHDQLKATQAQLVQSEKMASLGALTAGIAHEIKNPLNFVNNFAEMVGELAQELDEETGATQDVSGVENTSHFKEILSDLKMNADQIAKHGRRADSIVQGMMQHASGGKGQRHATDLNQLVLEHIDLAFHGKRAQMPDLKVEIEKVLGADLKPVDVVPQEIGRVLLNLLGNAFDAVHEHANTVNGSYAPKVIVMTRQVDGNVEVRIADNGPGIPPEIKEKVFEPFFTTKPTGSGTGLGLSLSYDIVTQGHGGTLTVDSEVGQGATFVVALPVKQ